jgi:uncharacterized protein (TIGR00161 family)
MTDISIVEYTKRDLSDAMLVVAFPSVGLVGSIAGNFIINSLKLEEIGMVNSPEFAPITVIHKGKPSPPVRIYTGKKKCGPDGTCEQLAVIFSEFAPPPQVIRPLATEILQWAQTKKCKIILALEGMQVPKKTKDQESQIFGIGSTPDMKKILKKYKITPTEEGMVVGLSGILLLDGTLKKHDIICMLAETHATYPDSRASARLLEKIDKMLPLIKIETDPLYKEAEEIEKKITQYINTSKTAPTPIPTTPSTMYR